VRDGSSPCWRLSDRDGGQAEPARARLDEDGSVTARRTGPATPTVSMRVVQALIGAVEQAGVARDELLRAAGLEAAQLEADEKRMTRSDVYRICELAIELTGDPALGLHWAERLTVNTFVPVSYLIAHSANLRTGFESLSRFARLLSDEPSYELIEQAGKLTVRCLGSDKESLRIQRFSAEMYLAGLYRVVRSFDLGARPERVSFAYAAPPYHEEYARVFDRPVHFEQPFTGIVFEQALLTSASPHRDQDIHDTLRALAERRMSRLTQGVPYALRARELLVQRGWPERMDMQTVARALGLSVRSLRRRLAAEGKSYSDIENDAFAIVAKQLLRDKRRTIQETAYDMGFSDTTTFHRAFKRATGTTPSKFRDDQPRGARR
jgi:AraC-like DNA-binding protein